MKLSACHIAGLATLLTLYGCAGTPNQTGFLSDYSRLKPDDGALIFVDNQALAGYSKFIVDPVTVHFHDAAKGKDTDAEKLGKLKAYLQGAITKALSDGYSIVSQPGPGVGRLRVAITDVQHDTPALNALPQTRITGLGLGGASMEAELVDSQTDRQIGAAIRAGKGSSLSLDGFSEWSSAEAVMDEWAATLRKTVDEAHGG